MYKILKFPYDQRNKHFFTTDFHNYHNPSWDVPIWKMRGYDSHEESHQDVQSKVNARVGSDDYMWVLGDSFLSATDEQVMGWWSGVNCQNIMYLFGNHSSQMYRLYKKEMVVQYGRDDIEVYPLKMNNVVFVGNHIEIQIGKQKIVLNHFPLKIWNGNNRGSWAGSGHSHLSDKERSPEFPLGKAFDLGWDYKKDIWSFEEMEDVMSTKSIHVLDHHDSMMH